MFITNKNISESLVRSLQNSFTSQANCEITLMCEGKTIKCHRHVLVLHSTHFNNLFKEQNDFPSAIAVVNMKFIHLKAMVDYMYFGRIKLQEDTDEMKQIIKCAEDLGLSALVTFITEFLKNSAKHKSLNGSANNSTSDLNGDDSLMKRKRASEIGPRVNNDSFKKPKLNDSSNKTSTPLRDSRPGIKSNLTSDVKVNSDNSETLILDKKRKSDDEEADDEESRRRIKEEEEEKKRKAKEEDERRRKREEDERKRRDEEERKRREEEKQKLEEEKRKKAEEEKRKAEEAERIRIEEEKRKKALEKKRQEEEEAARRAEEERSKKETKCDESASTKSCAVCNKQYKDNIDHRKVLEGVTFEKKCIMTGCSKGLPFRRALIDHLLKAHKIDVCDG